MSRMSKILLLTCLVSGPAIPVNVHGQDSKKSPENSDTKIIAEYKNQITNADPFDRMRSTSHHKIYILKMKAGKGYKIQLESTDFIPLVCVEDEKGNRLMDGSRANNQGSRVHFTPTKSGTYRLIATTLGAGQTGFFKMTVYPALPRKTLLAKQDKLTTKDKFDRIRRTSYCKIYQVKMTQGKEYEINMSSQFDTYLRLEDNNNNQLAQDDDGGTGLNSRLIFRAPRTGVYRVIATTFGPNQTGNFLLNVIGE